MASTRKLNTKDGQIFYEIIVSRGRGKSQLTTRWYPPKGWSQKAIDRELVKFKAEFERKVKAGEIVSREEQAELDRQKAAEAALIKTMRQYYTSVFMPALVVRCSENTRASYQGNLDNWILPALGDLKVPDITAAQIEALLLSIQAQGKSHGTAVKIYTILLGIFKKARKDGTIQANPMELIDRPKSRKDEIKATGAEAYTAKEVQEILNYLNQEPLKWRVFVHLLIDTGIRRGECCGLQWMDIDFKACTITIKGNLCYTPEKGIYLDTPKNGKTRTIDVDPEVMELLKLLRREQAKKVLSPYVFTQEDCADPMHPCSPTAYLRKFSKKYGIDHLHPHKLRHSFASVAITSGADVASVSEKLGHADKAVTLRMYTHSDQENMKKAGQVFRDAIKQA